MALTLAGVTLPNPTQFQMSPILRGELYVFLNGNLGLDHSPTTRFAYAITIQWRGLTTAEFSTISEAYSTLWTTGGTFTMPDQPLLGDNDAYTAHPVTPEITAGYWTDGAGINRVDTQLQLVAMR